MGIPSECLAETFPSSVLILSHLEKISSLIDPEHTISHALQVQKNGGKYAKILSLTNLDDLEILDTACLLHDVGRALRQKTDHPDAREHVVRGVNLACQILTKISPFSQDSRRLNMVLALIYHHDDEFYQFAFYPCGRNTQFWEILIWL